MCGDDALDPGEEVAAGGLGLHAPASDHVELNASTVRPLKPVEERRGVPGEAIQVEDHHDLSAALTDPRVQAFEALAPAPADSVVTENIGNPPALRRRVNFDP